MIRPSSGRTPLLLATLVLSLGPQSAAAQQWTFHGVIAQGGQHDAVRGPNDVIHLVSSRYYQIDINGAVLVNEAVGDDQQNAMLFPPAIAAGDDGTVHLVTRHSGSMDSGLDIRYRRRSSTGSWDRDYIVGSRVKRNYVVGVAWDSPGKVYMSSSQAGSNVWGDLHIWQPGATSATLLGAVGGVWRADCHSRMRAIPGRLFLVSGKPDGGGSVAYFHHGKTSTNLVANLNKNKKSHVAGSLRTGFPDLYIDGTSTVHFTFGAQEAVHYNKYTAAGAKVFASDQQIFSGLGAWHMSAGLSAVAASDDGQTVVAVALRTDGTKLASNSDLLWAHSLDGGASWSQAQDMGHNTDAGEGRHLPRLVAIGNRFFLLYVDKASAGISMASLHVIIDRDGDSHPAETDCDDGAAEVHPGAAELCNGKDDNCDKRIDEGCGPDAGTHDAGAAHDGRVLDGSRLPDAPPSGDGVSPNPDAAGRDLSVLEASGKSYEAGCDCELHRGSGPDAIPPALFLLLMAMGRRRRRNS